ncbi:hypothetical protein NC651_028604 [Populus alba x Populus x berolinensis]|nr:hypothetical protein NC651_028604 [Populus alba x Populus x berolinensis]
MLPSLETIIKNDEINKALFSIPDDNALGSDGYSSLFFKRSWGIFGSDFFAGMKYFFEFSTLPRCVNATRIALVLKIKNHLTMNDFRPIFCCNVMYKCISKVIMSRLQLILLDVMGFSHTAFVYERHILDVILLTQELMHNYHLPDTMSRCALKINIKKAFETINWEFILLGLRTIEVPSSMIRWIEVCMSTVHFSMTINRELHGFFSVS